MGVSKIIKIGKYSIQAFAIPLQTKRFILLKGRKGYVMCGYLNLKAANAFRDVAVRIVGVSTIKQALGTKVHSLSHSAQRLGIHKGQLIRDVLKIIA
ncbi:MAG: DUF1805 domain-containing protein [Candidatus Omnitrophota bacterium]|nr:MAG: DUF1805 domain-containing protein [Candidatus Omnitrophota bacterium]